MKSTLEIHETAFVTATYRASNVALSKDIYSPLWRNTKTDRWISRYVHDVSQDEPYVHCLRNRYFLDTITQLIEEGEIKALLNFGCGFSMYPFLLPDSVINVEIDQRDLIAYKRKKVEHWMKTGELPQRTIHYIGKDFKSDTSNLKDEIQSITQGVPTFILLEGVVFFLSREDTSVLMQLFGELQEKSGYVGSVSFLDTIVSTDCFQRLLHFYEREVTPTTKFTYQTIPTAFYQHQQQYDLIAHEDYVSLSAKFDSENKIQNEEEILNEHMYLLKRISDSE